ncbi:flavin reductase family protein [Lysobacter korlensis]|uniref:Flavin reductase family protein n=1 Tax=Lysobacter korlensis TaxID=553636 RepID=A0ABV6RX79_9GAMM
MSDIPSAADIERTEEFKKVFRRHPAGVAVITARRPDGTPVGFTATSVSSLAAVPPLVSFNMARVSSAWPAMEGTEHVLVHMLGVDDKELAIKMAGPAAERFVGDHWSPGPQGLPLLKGVPAWMLGRIVERVPVANNAVVVVEVEVGELGEYDEGLIYAERTYHRLGPEL